MLLTKEEVYQRAMLSFPRSAFQPALYSNGSVNNGSAISDKYAPETL